MFLVTLSLGIADVENIFSHNVHNCVIYFYRVIQIFYFSSGLTMKEYVERCQFSDNQIRGKTSQRQFADLTFQRRYNSITRRFATILPYIMYVFWLKRGAADMSRCSETTVHMAKCFGLLFWSPKGLASVEIKFSIRFSMLMLFFWSAAGEGVVLVKTLSKLFTYLWHATSRPRANQKFAVAISFRKNVFF